MYIVLQVAENDTSVDAKRQMRGLVCLQIPCNDNFDCPYMFVAVDGACAFQACIEMVSDLEDEQVFVLFFLGHLLSVIGAVEGGCKWNVLFGAWPGARYNVYGFVMFRCPRLSGNNQSPHLSSAQLLI